MAFFRSFKRPEGIAGWALLLWGVVGNWSDVEFVLGKARSLAPIMPTILDVLGSSWFRLLFVVVGLTLIWLSTRPKVGFRLVGASEAREMLRELRPSVTDMMAGADESWRHLADIVPSFGIATRQPLSAFMEHVNAGERDAARRAADDFLTVLHGKGDPRPLAAKTYTAYRQWRAQVLELARMMNHPIRMTRGFSKWKEGDDHFLKIIREKLNGHGLETVRQEVTTYDDQHGPPGPLSPD